MKISYPKHGTELETVAPRGRCQKKAMILSVSDSILCGTLGADVWALNADNGVGWF